MKKIQYSTAMMANPMKPEEARKAYANLQLTGVVDINELAEHITEHNSVFSKGTIVGILNFKAEHLLKLGGEVARRRDIRI